MQPGAAGGVGGFLRRRTVVRGGRKILALALRVKDHEESTAGNVGSVHRR